MRKLSLLEEVTHQGHPGTVGRGGAGPRSRRAGVDSGFSTPPLPTCHPHGTLAPLGTCFPALNLGVITVPSSRGYFKHELTAVSLTAQPPIQRLYFWCKPRDTFACMHKKAAWGLSWEGHCTSQGPFNK